MIVLISLITWILSIWGINIPYASFVVKAIFESSITLVLAFFCWKIASSYLERKIQEGSPVLEKMKDDDNEFGSSTPRGRAHTLLPILRKLFGTILVTMVLLIVASSFGVNIGPLLAGAGVIGLAFGDSSLNFELRAWISDINDRLMVHSELNQDIENEFQMAGVEIPFPQRDLHLKSVDNDAIKAFQQATARESTA